MSDKDVFLTSSSSGEEIPKWILDLIEKSGTKTEPTPVKEVKEGSVLRFVFKESAPAPAGSKGKGNESHDNKGRFTSKDKAVGPKGKVQAPESNKRQEAIGGDRSENLTQGMKAFDAEVWKAKGMMKAREEWKVLSRVEKDAMANPRETVQARVQELLSGVGAMPDTGNTKADIKARLEQIGDRMPEEARKLTETMISTLSDDLDAAGVERALARDMTLTALDHVAAQDIEAYSRTLGDHGVYHLNGDAVLAKDVLSVIPGNHNTPANRALMSLVAVYHDSGYLTPPSRSFLDSDHPRWSAQYFNENIAGSVEKAFGKDVAQLATQLIASHDHQGVNWEDEPELSAFSIADNFALFHKEKMPPMLRYVPANVKTLVDLAEKKLDLENAKAQMRKNIAASGLSKSVKAQFNSAVDEVSGVLPKFTLGMVGASLDKVKWNKDHLSINIKRRASNESLAKVLDMGYKQFAKLAETYGESPDTLIKKKRMELKTKDGRNLLEVTLQDILKKMAGLSPAWWGASVKKSFGGFSPVFKFNPYHDKAGRFASKDAVISMAAARKLAKSKLSSYYREGGDTGFTHSERIAAGLSDPVLKTIAYLHDVVEDSDTPLEDVRSLFGDRVADAVDILTKRDGQPLEDYLQGVMDNPDALQVKIADMADNMVVPDHIALNPHIIYKQREYAKAFPRLLEALERHKAKKANPYHDERGRFTSKDKASSNADMGAPAVTAAILSRVDVALSRLVPSDIPTSVTQPKVKEDDIESLYREANEARPEFVELLRGIQTKLHGKEVYTQLTDALSAIERGTSEPLVVDGGLKGRKSVIEKAEGEYVGHGGFAGLLDVVRGSIVVGSVKDLETVMEVLSSSGLNVARKPKNRFLAPGPDGYRDIQINIRMSNGHVAELQVQLKKLYLLKETKGHPLYEELRVINRTANKTKRPLTSEEMKKTQHLLGEMRKLYNPAWVQLAGA